MWKLFEDIYPDKFAYGCAAHAANLLVKDIFQIPTAPAPLLAFRCQRLVNCLLLVREITIIMKNILKLKADLNALQTTNGKKKLSLPCFTRCSPGVDLGKINRITAEYADYLKDIKTRVKNKDQLLLMIKNNQENRQVLDYWMEVETRFPLLSHLALKIFKLPVSSAYMERTFSIDKFIHCKSRNRLLDEKTKKLVIIKLNAPLLSNQANLFGEEDPQAIGENHQEESNHEEEEEEEEFHDNFETGDDGEVDSVMDDDD
jgi:hypothetical protein